MNVFKKRTMRSLKKKNYWNRKGFGSKTCENKEHIRSATGTNPDCFMRLFNNLNPKEDRSNIIFYSISKHLSEENYTNSCSYQSLLYSHYKSHVTYKGLIGMSPPGSITFISELYDNSITDKEMIIKSGILEKELWSPGYSDVLDHGFTIESDWKS